MHFYILSLSITKIFWHYIKKQEKWKLKVERIFALVIWAQGTSRCEIPMILFCPDVISMWFIDEQKKNSSEALISVVKRLKKMYCLCTKQKDIKTENIFNIESSWGRWDCSLRVKWSLLADVTFRIPGWYFFVIVDNLRSNTYLVK